jgi:malate dehydrogenase
MVLAILGDTGRMLPVSAYAHGEYGIEDVFIGMPSRLGRGGVTEVVELPLSTREIEALRKAAEAVRSRVTRGPGTNS